MRHFDLLQTSSWLWITVAAGCIACGGSDSNPQATTGGAATVPAGGSSQAGTTGGGSAVETGGSSSAGGASTGGETSDGGATNAGGTTSTAGATAAGGTANGGGGSTGGTTSTGGSSSTTAGGSKPTGGSTSTGGTSSPAGGTNAVGGTTSTGGSASTTGGSTPSGGTTSTGGTMSTGGTTSTGGGSAVGGRGEGICPGGSYPTPATGSATLATSSSDAGQYEGTLWLDSQGVLLFSGMNTNASGVVPATVGQLTPPSTVNTSLVADSGTNGLAIDFNGTILGGSQKVQGIVSINITSGAVTTLVNTDANGKKFNSINDLTVRTDGTIYFTDPDYQLGGRNNETGIKGVYRYSPSKVVSIVDNAFNEPNGVSLSPDETVLYVADTPANRIRKFTVAADGSTSGRADLVTMTSPDGGAVDCAGNLYWASNATGTGNTTGGVIVISPSGTVIGKISTGTSDKPTNVAFGGADHKTIYISTSPRKIYSFDGNVPGFPY